MSRTSLGFIAAVGGYTFSRVGEVEGDQAQAFAEVVADAIVEILRGGGDDAHAIRAVEEAQEARLEHAR
jgi:hypothetical protein